MWIKCFVTFCICIPEVPHHQAGNHNTLNIHVLMTRAAAGPHFTRSIFNRVTNTLNAI
jgi:hypothetical protein